MDTRGLKHGWKSSWTYLGKSIQQIFLAQAPALQLVAFSSHMMLPFVTFMDTGGLQYCSESHETFLGKSFNPNFLARAPALQSVAFRQSTGRP